MYGVLASLMPVLRAFTAPVAHSRFPSFKCGAARVVCGELRIEVGGIRSYSSDRDVVYWLDGEPPR